jgi:hypothetical protein
MRKKPLYLLCSNSAIMQSTMCGFGVIMYMASMSRCVVLRSSRRSTSAGVSALLQGRLACRTCDVEIENVIFLDDVVYELLAVLVHYEDLPVAASGRADGAEDDCVLGQTLAVALAGRSTYVPAGCLSWRHPCWPCWRGMAANATGKLTPALEEDATGSMVYPRRANERCKEGATGGGGGGGAGARRVELVAAQPAAVQVVLLVRPRSLASRWVSCGIVYAPSIWG